MGKVMQKNKILQDAVSKHLRLEDIGDNCKSAFAAVHQCISAVDVSGLTEGEKRELLISSLQKFWHGRSPYVAGCKREQIQKIVKLAFGIGSDRANTLNKEIRSYSFQELYLYYCYIERIAKGDIYFSKLLWENNKIKQEKEKAQKRAEREQKEKEQKEAENRRIGEMSQKERWQHEIFEKQQDMNYFQRLDDVEFSQEDKIIIAGLLKDYWEKTGKWEGNKVSKKQVVKITRVQEILQEKK